MLPTELPALRLVRVPHAAPPYDCQLHGPGCPGAEESAGRPAGGRRRGSGGRAAGRRARRGGGTRARRRGLMGRPCRGSSRRSSWRSWRAFARRDSSWR